MGHDCEARGRPASSPPGRGGVSQARWRLLPHLEEGIIMKVVRAIGFAVLVAAAVGIYVGLAPASTNGAVASVLADAKLNELSADSSPQQQVVNGWAAKDLLAVVARQGPDNRVPALPRVGIVVVAWGLVAPPSSRANPVAGDSVNGPPAGASTVVTG